jgi:hypothetical protein
MNRSVIACVLACACKSSEPEPAPEPAKVVDITALPIEHATQVLDHGTVSIDVPKGIPHDVYDGHYAWWRFAMDQPHISVESGLRATHTREIITPAQRVKNLVRAMEDATLEPVVKRELPDGALVIFERPDHSHLRVFVDRWREGWSVLCEVMVPPRTGAIPQFDAIKAWAERTCLSTKIESLKPL